MEPTITKGRIVDKPDDPISRLERIFTAKINDLTWQVQASLQSLREKRESREEPEARDIKMNVHVEHVDREEPREIPPAALAALREFHRHWKMDAAIINSNDGKSNARASFSPREEPLEDPEIGGEVFRPDQWENFIFFEVQGKDDLDLTDISVSGIHSVSA